MFCLTCLLVQHFIVIKKNTYKFFILFEISIYRTDLVKVGLELKKEHDNQIRSN